MLDGQLTITFNDDAMIGVLKLFREIAKKKEDYLFVDEERRLKAERAVARALPLILKHAIDDGVIAGAYDALVLLAPQRAAPAP